MRNPSGLSFEDLCRKESRAQIPTKKIFGSPLGLTKSSSKKIPNRVLRGFASGEVARSKSLLDINSATNTSKRFGGNPSDKGERKTRKHASNVSLSKALSFFGRKDRESSFLRVILHHSFPFSHFSPKNAFKSRNKPVLTTSLITKL